MTVITPLPIEIIPRALHRLDDAFEDLRKAIHRAQAVKDVFPLWHELRALEQHTAELTNLAANKAEELLEQDQ